MALTMVLFRVNRQQPRLFIPIATVTAVFIIGSAALLSALFTRQSDRILQQHELERLHGAIGIFSRIQLDSIPAYVNAIENGPIRDYLYGRLWSTERTLRALEMIDQALIGNDFIDSFYLYHEATGILSTRSGWEGFQEPSDPGLLALLSDVRRYGLSTYVPRRVVFQNEEGTHNLFTMILGNVPPEGEKMRFAFVVNLSERRIRRAIANDNSNSSLVYIIDQEKKYLSHPDPLHFGEPVRPDDPVFSILSMNQPEGNLVLRDSRGERWITAWSDHPELRWRFVSMTPEKIVFAPITQFRDTLVVIVISALLLSVLTAYIVSYLIGYDERRNHLALKFLRDDAEDDFDAGVDYSVQPHTLFKGFNNSFALAMVIADKHNDVDNSLQNIPPRSTLKEAFSLVGHKSMIFSLSSHTVLTLFPRKNDEPLTWLTKMLSETGTRLGLTLGGYHIVERLTLDLLPRAYQKLAGAFKNDYIRNSGALIPINLYEETIAPSDTPREVGELDLGMLERAFRMGNQEEALHAVDQLLKNLRDGNDPDAFHYTLALLSRRIPEILGTDAELLLRGEKEAFSNALRRCERVDGATKLLRMACAALRERGELHNDKKKKELLNKIKDMVDSRLADKTLGTAMIASELNFSTNYIREFFKQHEGTPLLEYIGAKRVELAKVLLTGTNASIRDVCDHSGFINYSYFFTYFKKNTGLTPMEFKKNTLPHE